MLIIRANHDLQTNYLYEYSKELIDYAKGYNLKVYAVEGGNINFKVVQGKITKIHPRFIFFNGHGSSDCLYDNQNKPFIDMKSSVLFNKAIVYTRACDCLNVLGACAVKNGCTAFIGYRNKFWIARKHVRECNPLKDDVARPVLECSNVIVKELIKGKTVQEAIQRSHKLSIEYILKLLPSKEPLAPATLRAIMANDYVLDFEGNADSTIV